MSESRTHRKEWEFKQFPLLFLCPCQVAAAGGEAAGRRRRFVTAAGLSARFRGAEEEHCGGARL